MNLIVKALTFMALCWATGLGAAAMELDGKVVCGYQGWFRTPDDGSGTGWHHYTQGDTMAPGHCGIDLWPDVRELPEADRVATPFRHPDGSPAQVFSSVRPSTVALHFQWMQDYGIDGIFLQRFAVTLKDPRYAKPMDQVLRSCQESAAKTKRGWAVMYDLSGASKTDFALLQRDWTRLRAEERMTDAKKSPTYFHHRKKPVIGLWGLGFNDREPMLEEWRELLTFFKEQENGGCSIVLGVPAWWRTGERDAIKDPVLLELIAMADVVSPWNTGRFATPEQAAKHVEDTGKADIDWCRKNNLSFLPVVFPGFSWTNLSKQRGKDVPLNQIPRLGGRFLWQQIASYHEAGATMLYVAMFDELDEGTAIFKVRQDPPGGASAFVSEKDVPGDHYLRITGKAGALLRGASIEIRHGVPIP